MFYLKPLIKRMIYNPEIVNAIEKMNNDKEALDYLINMGQSKSDIISQFERHYAVKYIDLSKTTVERSFFDGFDMDSLKKAQIIPLDVDKASKVKSFVVSNIMDMNLKKGIRSAMKSRGLGAEFQFAFDHEIVEKYKEIDLKISKPKEVQESSTFDAERFVDKILINGIKKRASDIHIESLEAGLQVRYRVDGVLLDKDTYSYSESIISSIMVRIKVVSSMDISEKRKPQDGRLDNFEYGNNLYDFRVSSVKTIFGEKVVMRIFNKTSSILSFKELGFTDADELLIKKMLKSKNGIIYLAGATGSGKTTTLYSMINEINNDEINIYTIEDPVEKSIENVNQIQIDPLAGIDYSNTLRALLRQDPDVIVVGEIRDAETADLSVRASLTGHLVLSTIHANNALDSISRLTDMNIESYLLGASSLGFISQRLVRKLCPHCKKPVKEIPEHQKLWLAVQKEEYGVKVEDANIFEAGSCSYCNNGYIGRIAVVEIIHVNEDIKTMIKNKENTLAIKNLAMKNGYKPLMVNAFESLNAGITSIEEIMKQI